MHLKKLSRQVLAGAIRRSQVLSGAIIYQTLSGASVSYYLTSATYDSVKYKLNYRAVRNTPDVIDKIIICTM